MKRVQSYLESLADDRCVWLDGEKVSVLDHPAFQGTLRSIMRLFHMLDDNEIYEKISYLSPSTGERVHISYQIPKSLEDIRRRRSAFQIWCDETDGMMSRLSDYARSRLTGWVAARKEFAKYNPDFSDKILKYYEYSRDENRFISIVQRDVQLNRAKQYDARFFAKSGLLQITKKTAEGVYVSGAKMIATAAPYTNEFIVYPVMRLSEEQKSAANMLIVPADAKGLHMACRESFAVSIDKKTDYPLSSQYDEMDALLIFDDVFIPWEYVLIHEDPEAIWKIKGNRHSNSLGYHQALIRLHTKLEFITGLACKLAETTGSSAFLHVQEMLGELIIQGQTLKGLILAAEIEGEVDEEGIYLPSFSYIESGRNLGTTFYPRTIEILQRISAGGNLQVPSSLKDFSTEISPLMKTYFRGADIDAEGRTKLMKLAWDLIGTPFASRHSLYEHFYAGDPIRNRASQYLSYNKGKLIAKVEKYL
ncbi:4-hydroxyphenylacetate 3-monooxygenase [Marininema mesophilum]|uniref:4-hydroxyphenylacetate 3-monooxygenase n=1 Tax=Marininema mesophilum TaxID=1048340 RepID=A0A1H2ZG15_9BACL|nr:4-hydroxyphenylacetate 3-hydroxylase N-terminal domain-containing protein [Marininema mesophilum]SDX16433.1 4-hydroxyphenylacetate 3-monooxygenase [Marininema mesophilum]